MKPTADLLITRGVAGQETTKGSESRSHSFSNVSVEIPGFDTSAEILNSWKEIAAYTHRGVRTVQRWEVELKFPIHRPHGKDHSPVIALKSEIDLWFRTPHKQKNANSRHQRHFEMQRRLLNNTRLLETRTATLINSRDVLLREINRALKLVLVLRSAGGSAAHEQ